MRLKKVESSQGGNSRAVVVLSPVSNPAISPVSNPAIKLVMKPPSIKPKLNVKYNGKSNANMRKPLSRLSFRPYNYDVQAISS